MAVGLRAAEPEYSRDVTDAPWGTLYPWSSVLVPDESRLYVGMRQFVGEVDLATNHLRLLVPSTDFLNKLPNNDEKRIRAQYSKGMGDWHPPADICAKMGKG